MFLAEAAADRSHLSFQEKVIGLLSCHFRSDFTCLIECGSTIAMAVFAKFPPGVEERRLEVFPSLGFRVLVPAGC